MPGLLIGALAAIGAAGLYAVGIALQGVEARAAPSDQALQLSLFRRLVRRPRWLAGTVLGLIGWGLQAFALLHAPLTLVQPLLGTNMVFLLAIAAWYLHEQVSRSQAISVVVLAAGVPMLALTAPHRSATHAGAGRVWATLTVLGVLALVPLALRGRARSASLLVPIGAGLAYSWDGLATKFASDDYATHLWLGVAFWFVLMNAAAGLGTLAEMSALQTRAVAQVAPLVFALTTFVPVALAPLLAREWWPASAARDVLLVLALLLTGGGALALARAEPIARALADASSTSSGTGRSPRAERALISLASERSREAP
jgi:drug/metabolite transporter (DMT)-like permease